MDILMSETCWAHKKWNKIASDIKLVFYSSTITMMNGPINIKLNSVYLRLKTYTHLVARQAIFHVPTLIFKTLVFRKILITSHYYLKIWSFIGRALESIFANIYSMMGSYLWSWSLFSRIPVPSTSNGFSLLRVLKILCVNKFTSLYP